MKGLIMVLGILVAGCSQTQYDLPALPQKPGSAQPSPVPAQEAPAFAPGLVNTDLEKYLVGISTILPPDSKFYRQGEIDWATAAVQGRLGRESGLPEALDGETGYPAYPVKCFFGREAQAECTQDDGSKVSEEVVANHTTLVRNRDVIGNPNLQCGLEVCISKETSMVVGHISHEMIAWRKSHCTWDLYAKLDCPEVRPYEGPL